MIGINSFGIVLFLAFGIVWGQYDMKPITPEPIRYMLLFMGLFHAASINMALAVIQLIFEEKATDKESIDHHGAATIRSS